MTATVQYFTVVQHVDIASPTPAPAEGTVTFTPSVTEVSSTALDELVFIKTVTGYLTPTGLLNEYNQPLQLVDNQNLGFSAGQLTYLVTYVVDGQQITPTFRIAAPGNGSSVDLANPANQLPVSAG